MTTSAGPAARDRVLWPVSAWFWALQFAVLNPILAVLLATLYGATDAEVGLALGAYNIGGFLASLAIPAAADRRSDYLRPLLLCGASGIALVAALAIVPSLPFAVVALVLLGGPLGVGSTLLFAQLRHSGAAPERVVRTRAIVSFAWVAGPVLATAVTVVVNSRHEQALLEDLHPGAPVAAVIPLPVHRRRAPVRPRLEPVAAVLGYVYPGKGHREVITALAQGGTGLAFRALGAPSAGHERDAEDLVLLGQRLGVVVAITGYLTDPGLRDAASTAAVPVVAHQHLSASGSINSWIAAGRRPIAIRSRYTEEMDALRPGTLRLTTPDGLASAIADAAADPASTMLGTDPVTRPHLDDTASAYLDLWRRTA